MCPNPTPTKASVRKVENGNKNQTRSNSSLITTRDKIYSKKYTTLHTHRIMLNSKAIFYFSTFSPIFYFFWFRASLIYLNFLQKFTKTSIFRSITIEYRISSNNPTPLNNRTPSINRTPKMEVEIIIGHLRIIGHV